MDSVESHAAGIDDIDRDLVTWVKTVLGPGIRVQLETGRRTEPVPASGGSGVSLRLFALAPAPPPRGEKRSPHQVHLRYRVATWAEQPEAAHRMLSELLFAALDRPDVEVDLGAGANDDVDFVIQVPLRRPRPEGRAPRVRGPLKVDAVPMAPLSGVVLGPDDVPLTGALVEVPGLDLTSRTDHRGAFRFAGLPATAKSIGLRVRAKGTVLSFRAPATGKPITVRVDIPEDVKEG